MSKVKIEGNASGTGTFTIASPNSNTDRTLTLPDGAGEILTDASSLPAANLTGTLPAIDGSALTGIDAGEITSSSYSASGYVVMDDGLIIQWVNISASAADTTITFPMTFPNACRTVHATSNYTSFTSSSYIDYIRSVTTTGCIVENAVAGNLMVTAIGY